MGDHEITTYYLYFDVINGPQITNQIGQSNFDENDLLSLKCCAFPDSSVQSMTESLIYIFKIKKYYCYTIFTSISDPSVSRGFRQFSYVIATTLPYIYPFTRILHSAKSLFFDMDPNDTLALISDFAIKTISLLPTEIGDEKEIPTFDGGLPVALPPSIYELLDFQGGIGWTPLCKKYFLNSNFIGIDLFYSLSINQLLKSGKVGDVLRLWEAVILGESIMVFGSNPAITSAAVLALASLTFPHPIPDNIFPYISVTDPRHKNLMSNHNNGNCIVGFSNPIVLQNKPNFTLLFQTGFRNNNDGLTVSKHFSFPSNIDVKSLTNTKIRTFFYRNTAKLSDAINFCLQGLRNQNPYAEFALRIDPNVLADKIAEKGVQLTHAITYKDFAIKLLHSPFLLHILAYRCDFTTFRTNLKGFSVDDICSGKSQHELIDLRSMVQYARDKCRGNKILEEIIDADLTTITLHLSPNVILAPVMMD